MYNDEVRLQTTYEKHFVFIRWRHICGCFELTIQTCLSLSIVDKNSFGRDVKFDCVSNTSFMRFISERTKIVHNKVSEMLQSSFSFLSCIWWPVLHADTFSWSFCIVPLCLHPKLWVYFLDFPFLQNESILNTGQRYQLMSYILDYYRKAWEIVSCLVGDNCATNRAIANRATVPLVGCASLSFIPKMAMVLQDDKILLEQVNNLIQKVKGLTFNSKIFKGTVYLPWIR